MLQSYNALSVVGESSRKEETVPEEAGSVKSVSFWKESKSNELTTHLSNVDSHHFFSSIAHGHHPSGFDEIPATVLNTGEQTDVFGQKDAAVTPQWLVNTAPRFILGSPSYHLLIDDVNAVILSCYRGDCYRYSMCCGSHSG